MSSMLSREDEYRASSDWAHRLSAAVDTLFLSKRSPDERSDIWVFGRSKVCTGSAPELACNAINRREERLCRITRNKRQR